ncbi:MAG: hypothetical protein ABJA69_00755 [Acidobacteriaceae bacterium]
MRHDLTLVFLILLFACDSKAASKPHVVSFGKWTSVKWMVGTDENTALDLKVRAIYVDSRLEEFTLGVPHDVTDRLFVVQRAFRLNDTLPAESASPARWQWQRGGWMLVDRMSGHISQLNLPEFDAYYSIANWYRDYSAYCGVSDDGKKVFAVVAQLGRRKPILKKALGDTDADGDPNCAGPSWQRKPARVTFSSKQEEQFTYAVHGHAVDVIPAEREEDSGTQ